MRHEKTYISLFGGIGGFDLPLQKYGWKCFWYCDCDTKCEKKDCDGEANIYIGDYRTKCNKCGKPKIQAQVQIYNKNFKTDYTPRDIRTVDVKEIPKHTLLASGFPCQSFSVAGDRQGFRDTRGTLFFEIARILEYHRSPYLLLENVQGLLNNDRGRTFQRILEVLDELGYDAEWQVLNSKYFGVPQNRPRVFLIGSLRGEPRPEVFPIKGNGGETAKDRQVVRSLTGGAHSGGLHSQTTGITTRSIRAGGRSSKDMKHTWDLLFIQADRSGKGYKSKEDRIYFPVGVAPCIPSSRTETHLNIFDDGIANAVDCDGYLRHGGHNYGSITDHRIWRLTPLECERLQAFPDGWTDGVADTHRYKALGNAVTTNVVEAIAERLNLLFTDKLT